MNIKLPVVLGLTALVCILTGCSDPRRDTMATNPETTVIGTFEGCSVSYVDRGYNIKSFYIAKCGNTTTTTNNYYVREGKTDVFHRRTEITSQIDKLNAEKADLDKQINARQAALSKLSPADRAALGVTIDDSAPK